MNDLEVLYEDNHLLVVVKPFNVLSQGDITGDMDLLTLAKQYIKEKYQKSGNVYLGLVHRLDRPTMGIMVFARTSKAAARLSKQIANHQFVKKYYAVVHGILPEMEGVFQDYLKKYDDGTTVVSDSKDGKYAELSYSVISKNLEKNLSLVEVSLKTGRHHQIRVQFASRGFPLYGDARYGKNSGSFLCLVAYSLSFYHPVTKELLTFCIDCPMEVEGFHYFKDKFVKF